MTTAAASPSARRNPRGARAVCASLGVVLLTAGVLGLVSRGLGGFGDTTGETVLGFGGSPLLNVAHLVLGLLALGLARRASGARIAGLVGGLTFLGLTAYDVVALVDGTPGEPLSIRWPGLVLHAVALVVSVLVTVLANRDAHARSLAVRY